MKVGIFGIEGWLSGKANLVDKRLEELKQVFNSAKKAYIQVELITDQEKLKEADGIIAPEGLRADLILTDLEFVELRIARSENEPEKKLFMNFKEQLDKESFLSELALNEEEQRIISGYPLLTVKPIFLASPQALEDKDRLLLLAYNYFGYISFFTTNERQARAWSIRKNSSAWEAAGCIHSDIQKGFIRAEAMNSQDLINDGGLNQARSNNHLRLENKDYIVEDGDWIFFRFNK
ncbi:MAG: DUF933 domain-containing protein [Candidatus Omnitrophica bacterium]|nr:DUF933 domain-containing protein [Candidatus Omnitrophota bacterium]